MNLTATFLNKRLSLRTHIISTLEHGLKTKCKGDWAKDCVLRRASPVCNKRINLHAWRKEREMSDYPIIHPQDIAHVSVNQLKRRQDRQTSISQAHRIRLSRRRVSGRFE